MRVLFIGFALPIAEFEEVLGRDAGMPVQTQRFGWAVVEALRAAGVVVDMVSAAPATDYPNNSQLVFRGHDFEAGGVAGRTISFINITGAKHLTRFVTATRALRRVVRRAMPDAILVHGVHSPFIWTAVRAARRLGVPAAVILTDPPSLPTQFDGRLSRQFKRLDRRVILAGLARATGVVALTQGLADDLAAGKPSLQFEGIARPINTSSDPEPGAGRGSRVIYAGALSADYGLRNLVEAVDQSEGSWTLHVYGSGPMSEEVSQAATSSDRIVSHGLVDSDTLGSAYASAALLVNPRPVAASFVRYSFPSKLLEYLGTGRPVMTTRLPTIPDDYAEHLIYTGDTAGEMAAAIDAFFATPQPWVNGASGRDFIVSTRGVDAQGTRLKNFLSVLATEAVRSP